MYILKLKSIGDSMKKRLIFCGIFVIAIFASIFSIFFLYLKNSKDNTDYTKELVNNSAENYADNLELILTSYSGFKISPNARIIYETNYTKCNHTEVKEEIVSEELVNLNEEELQEKYQDYTIKQFGTEKVVLYNEIDGYCNNHYIIKENDGYIGIFKLKNNGEEELIRLTNISVQYLPETDLANIKDGLEVYGKDTLNKILEDFE